MLIITQILSFVLVLYLVLSHITSITDIGPIYGITLKSKTSQHNPDYFNPYSRVNTRQQLGSRLPNINEPLRDLKWGRLNFLHTTDTHGWYLGHTNQRQYSADWGDLISFHHNMQQLSNDQGVDLLMVDSGDRHDGNGLSDLTLPNGLYSSKLFMMLDYDLITVGNHELYDPQVSQLEYDVLVPRYGERFVSTNVQYKNDDDEWVVFGNNTFRYFQTKNTKANVLALSFLFDFRMGNERVMVTPIREIVKQDWFVDILKAHSDKVDAIVIFGHLPVAHDWEEMGILHSAIREYYPNTYIQYLGGHSHIRDFTVLDDHSTGIQSGRYCETVGFTSIQDLSASNIYENVDRKYIDFNLHSFMHHTRKFNLEDFNTETGLFVSKELFHFAKELKLNEKYGVVPQSYYMAAADYNNNDPKSLLRFLENDILPQLKPKSCNPNVESFNVESSNDRIIMINTGGIRYDLYKGDFTKNSLFTVSPFKNMWKVVPSVPTDLALSLQSILNNGDYIINEKQLKSPYLKSLEKNLSFNELNLNITNGQDERKPISYGHTTLDDFGIDGDDTIHKHLNVFYVPNVIQSHQCHDTQTEYTDVVYYDFIEPFILNALQQACNNDSRLYNNLASHITYYNDCPEEYNLGKLLKTYVTENWS